MAETAWEKSKTIYCDHVDCQVALEVEVAYPSEHLPDQLPRILARRCSHGKECSLLEKAACVWAGTNPNYDPFDQS